jgi:hypothetical protein
MRTKARTRTPERRLSLLMTCRQTKYEATSYFFALCTFNLDLFKPDLACHITDAGGWEMRCRSSGNLLKAVTAEETCLMRSLSVPFCGFGAFRQETFSQEQGFTCLERFILTGASWLIRENATMRSPSCEAARRIWIWKSCSLENERGTLHIAERGMFHADIPFPVNG